MKELKMITNSEGEVIAIEVEDNRIALREPLSIEDMKPYLQALHKIGKVIPLENMKMTEPLTEEDAEEFVKYMTPIQRALVVALKHNKGFMPKSEVKKKLSKIGIESGSTGGYQLSGTTAGLTRKINSWEIGVPIIEREWNPDLGEWTYKLNDDWRPFLEELL